MDALKVVVPDCPNGVNGCSEKSVKSGSLWDDKFWEDIRVNVGPILGQIPPCPPGPWEPLGLQTWLLSLLLVVQKATLTFGRMAVQKVLDSWVSGMDRRWVEASQGQRCCPCPRCGSPVWSYAGRDAVSKTFNELFGKLVLLRHYARCGQCKKGFYPLDCMFGLGAHRMFPLLQRACLQFGTHLPPRVASGILERLTLVRACSNTIAARVKELGKSVISRQETDVSLEVEQVLAAGLGAEGKVSLHAGLDGGMVPQNHLPKAAKGSHKEAWVGTLSVHEQKTGKRLGKVILARLTPLPIFLACFERLVVECQSVLPNLGRIRFHSDGARWIGNFLHSLGRLPSWILDWFHLKQNLWALAEKLGDHATAYRRAVLKRAEDALWVGNVSEAIGILKTMRFRYSFHREARDKLVGYIQERKDNMPNYEWLYQRSQIIGSGEVESAIKQVLHSRLRGPGMRWSREGADLVMAARCSILNGTWEYDMLQANLAA